MTDKSATFKGFVTKWALTRGIEERDIGITEKGYGYFTLGQSSGLIHIGREGASWFRTREEAVIQFKKLLKNKIAAIDKQKKKLQQKLEELDS